MKINVIQLKRGIRNRLITALRGINAPKDGEPVYEIDTGKLYIGNGITDFEFLSPIIGNGGDIQIESATDGQTLVYNELEDKWEAKNLADNKSIEYGQNGLRIAGFTGSQDQQGTVPVVNNGGITWQSQADQTALNNAVAAAQAHADRAADETVNARGFATIAATNAANTEAMVEQTAELYNNKFWYGTFAEYQDNVINTGKLTEGTIYFISDNPNN